MSKNKGIIKSIVAVVLVGGLAVGGYFLYKNFDTVKNKVTDWWNDITNQEEQKPTQNEQVKDFTFSGNKITGYIGSEVVLDNLPTSYSVEIGDVEESLEITFEDTSDEDAMKEFNEKIEKGSFYCTPNGGDRFFSATYEEWNEYMAEHYPEEEQMKAFPMKFEFCSVTFTEGTDYQITEIADGAFSYNTILSKVVIPENIQSIGQQAFYNCENLTEIELSEGITELKYNTFYGCKRLENITLPNSLTTIGYGVFDQTAIRTLTIPENVSEFDMIVSDNSALEELHINSILINPEQITSLASFTNKLKIYVPDDYFVKNYETFFNQYLNRIYPEHGTYPEEPDPEPEEKTVTVILMNGSEQVYSQEYKVGSYINFLDLEIEEPTQEGKLFLGWIMQGKDEILSNFNVTEAYGSTIVFEAKFYNEPQVLEEFDVNGNIKSDVETFTISSNYYFIKKHTNIATYSSKEEFLKAKDLYNGKNFAYKNESGSYTYLNQIDLESYEPNFNYPLTCSSIETSIYDLQNLTDEEISNFLQRNYYFIDIADGETYIGSEYEVCEYKNFQQSFSNSNLKTIILSEEITSLYDTVFADCQHLEKLIIKRDFLVSVYTNEGEVSDNLQLPDNCQIYVPDELLGEYKAVSFYQRYQNNIHPMSELELAEG